jgi:hypothetical protein
MKPLPCPFCGTMPEVGPKDPEKEGNAFGYVACRNRESCPATPYVTDGELVADERGTKAYQAIAIKRWNTRS